MKIPSYIGIFLKVIGAPLGIVVFLLARPVRGSLRSCSREEGFGGIRQLPELFHMCGVITLASVLMYVGFWIVAGFTIGFYLSVSSKK